MHSINSSTIKAGKGVGIRINDSGVDKDHPELQGRFDVQSSCAIFGPPNTDEHHGTFVAGLAAAAGNNGECAVGIAPEATISSCRVVGSDLATERQDDSFLYKFMDRMDISQNSYGVSGCNPIERRRLQTSNCPFRADITGSPCDSCGSIANWADPGAQCEDLIAEYCTGLALRIKDVEACLDYVDLYAQCQYDVTIPSTEEALARGITEGRGGKGIIYIFASGNDREFGSDVNMEAVLTSRYTIAIGSVNRDGTFTSFSVGGTSLLACAPAGDLDQPLNTISALAGGGCGDEGPGTSFSSPLVAGVVALVLEANSELSWRDVQGVLVTSCRRTDLNHPSWTMNAAGLFHSSLYGFGIVDAEAAVRAAQNWTFFTPERQLSFESTEDDTISIPESPDAPAVSSIQVSAGSTFVVESVTVLVDVDHATRGDLEIVLTSPDGVESILHPGSRPENSQIAGSWRMTTLKAWGTNPTGTWTLSLVDEVDGDLTSCVDYEWALSDGEGDFWRCVDLSGLYGEVCFDGGIGQDFDVVFGSFATDLDDFSLQDSKGLTPGFACCECGGGRSASDVLAELQSWTLVIHGHDPENTSPESASSERRSPAHLLVATSLWMAVFASLR